MNKTIMSVVLCLTISSVIAGKKDEALIALYVAIESSNIQDLTEVLNRHSKEISAGGLQQGFRRACDIFGKKWNENDQGYKDRKEILYALVNAGADVNAQDRAGDTRLHIATGYKLSFIKLNTEEEYANFKAKEYPLANVLLIKTLLSIPKINPLLQNNGKETAFDKAQMLQHTFKDDASISQTVQLLEGARQKYNNAPWYSKILR